jgi:GNAT superfamily N-acetyltransferase
MIIRAAEACRADISGIAKVHVHSWQTTYVGMVPDEFLHRLNPSVRMQQWENALGDLRQSVYVAEDESGKIVGFASGGPQRDESLPFDSELYAIYLLEAAQGRGTGRALATAVACNLLDRGCKAMLVWVLTENPSRCFYEKLGGVFVQEKPIEIAGKSLMETAYGWPDLQAFPGLNPLAH